MYHGPDPALGYPGAFRRGGCPKTQPWPDLGGGGPADTRIHLEHADQSLTGRPHRVPSGHASRPVARATRGHVYADYGMVGAHCSVFRDKPFVLAKNFHSSMCLSLCEPGLLHLLELPTL